LTPFLNLRNCHYYCKSSSIVNILYLDNSEGIVSVNKYVLVTRKEGRFSVYITAVVA